MTRWPAIEWSTSESSYFPFLRQTNQQPNTAWVNITISIRGRRARGLASISKARRSMANQVLTARLIIPAWSPSLMHRRGDGSEVMALTRAHYLSDRSSQGPIINCFWINQKFLAHSTSTFLQSYAKQIKARRQSRDATLPTKRPPHLDFTWWSIKLKTMHDCFRRDSRTVGSIDYQ